MKSNRGDHIESPMRDRRTLLTLQTFIAFCAPMNVTASMRPAEIERDLLVLTEVFFTGVSCAHAASRRSTNV